MEEDESYDAWMASHVDVASAIFLFTAYNVRTWAGGWLWMLQPC